jgi:hypothetical protein
MVVDDILIVNLFVGIHKILELRVMAHETESLY